MKIEEVCACGASLVMDTTTSDVAPAMRHVREWRRKHIHEFAPKRLASARALGFAAYRTEDDEDEDEDSRGLLR